MALGSGGCVGCGNPFCAGGCMQNATQFAAQRYQNELAKYQQQIQNNWPNAFGNGLAALGLSTFDEKPKTPRKALAEEEVVCATGGLIGWRQWRVPCFGNTLLSINGEVWPVREALRATCRNGPTNCKGVDCGCGIYAWKDRKDLKVNASEYSCVEGEVWLWGKIVEHNKGYRAEFAYPKSFVSSTDGKRLAGLYGVTLT